MFYIIPESNLKKLLLRFSGMTLGFMLAVLPAKGGVEAAEQKQINIDITTHLGNVRNYREGDKVSFLISLDTDAYVLVLYQNAGGEVIQLLPNKNLKNHFYKAGLFLNLPDPNSAYVFEIQAPFGRETLWAFAADVPLPELSGRYLADGLKKLVVSMASIRKTVAGHPKSAYGEARLLLHTKARKK